jgi:D-alanyl-D-alanine carboxypeptidase
VGAVAVLAAGSQLLASSARSGSAAPPPPPPTPEVVRCAVPPLDIRPLPCASAILIEAETGAVLYQQNADEKRGPASLVKMMVQLITFEEIEAGRHSLDEIVTTSANASTMGGSQVYLKQGETQTLEAMLDAIIIASANDAAMAVAEHIGGDEASFVKRMNEEAKRIGCTGTTFANVHGLDLRGKPRNVTTARDLAMIARNLVRHPKALEISSTWRMPFRNGEFWLNNTNKLLRDCDGLDGLKTGWTPRAGGCFVGTARRDGVRLIAVVLKAPSGTGRFRVAKRLLESGYEPQPRWVQVARAGQVIRPGENHVATAEAGGAPVPAEPVAARGSVRVLLPDGSTGTWRLRPREDAAGAGGEAWVTGYLDYRLDGSTVATVAAGPPGRS